LDRHEIFVQQPGCRKIVLSDLSTIGSEAAPLTDGSSVSRFGVDRSDERGQRILWFRSGTMRERGGAERVTIEGLRCFREMGAHITLLLTEPLSSETGAFFAAHHSAIESLQESSRETSAWFVNLFSRYFRRVNSLRKAIDRLRPDLIIANGEGEVRSLVIFSLGGILPLPPVITFIHGSPFQFANEWTKYTLVFRRHLAVILAGDPVYRELIPPRGPALGLRERLRLEFNAVVQRVSVRRSHVVFVLSEKNRDEVKLLYGVQRVEVACPGGFSEAQLDNAVPANRPALLMSRSGPILLSLCRLISKKRVDLIIRSFAIFLARETHSPATLLIAGTGAEETALRDLSESLGLSSRVLFVGFIPDEKIHDWYRACDLFLSADNADYDLTVMMALSEGKKIVVSTQYAIPMSLSKLRRFFVVATPSPEGYAEAIGSSLAMPPVALGDEDKRELQSMTWENYFRDVLKRTRRTISASE
jgi:glycosyltransferase involved in cell wall biosynthesis